jgi:hypothetical protein
MQSTCTNIEKKSSRSIPNKCNVKGLKKKKKGINMQIHGAK